jgi:hypothetical protein
MLSCIYYGVSLATLIAPVAALLSIKDRGVPWTRAVRPMAAGAALALVVCGLYAVPYLRQHARVGDRSVESVDAFSATPASYLSVPAGNALYGSESRPGRAERRLFPGSIVILLAITGLLLRAPSRRQLAYLLLLAAAFEISLGFGGYLYPVLHKLVPPFRGLRAMSRLGIFVVMGLAVLAAYGYAALMTGRSAAIRRAAFAVVACAMLLEYRTRLVVAAFPNVAPPVYRVLARQPPGVVAEFPVPRADALPGPDPRYAAMSIFHWFPLANGYSGNYPASYLARIDRLHDFPGPDAMRQLRRDGVRYVIVHAAGYSPADLDAIHAAFLAAGTAELVEQGDGEGQAHVFLMR